MKRLLRYLHIYANSTLAYGFTRAVTWDYSGTRLYLNQKTEKYESKEMLLTDKIGRVSGRTLMAVFAWPAMLGDDLARLECRLTGKDPAEYK